MQVLSTHTLHPRTSSVTCSYPGCRNHLCFGQVARFRSLGEASQKLVFCEAGTYVLCVCAAAFAFTSVPSRVTRLLFYVAICALSLSHTCALTCSISIACVVTCGLKRTHTLLYVHSHPSLLTHVPMCVGPSCARTPACFHTRAPVHVLSCLRSLRPALTHTLCAVYFKELQRTIMYSTPLIRSDMLHVFCFTFGSL